MTASREWPTSYQILAVVSRLQVYITGGFFAAIAFVYEHLSAKMISAHIVLWGVAGFFVTGACKAWREQYRTGSPVRVRDRLDGLDRTWRCSVRYVDEQKEKNKTARQTMGCRNTFVCKAAPRLGSLKPQRRFQMDW